MMGVVGGRGIEGGRRGKGRGRRVKGKGRCIGIYLTVWIFRRGGREGDG